MHATLPGQNLIAQNANYDAMSEKKIKRLQQTRQYKHGKYCNKQVKIPTNFNMIFPYFDKLTKVK